MIFGTHNPKLILKVFTLLGLLFCLAFFSSGSANIGSYFASSPAVTANPARANENASPSPNAQPQSRKRWNDPTTLAARVKAEKAKGHDKVQFAAPLMEYPDRIDLDTALAQATVVIAEVINKYSRIVDSHTIATFYRLRLIETLSKPNPTACCDPKDEDFPTDLPPLKDDEIHVVGIGGTVMLDGVEVTMKEDFENLVPGPRFLLFLSITTSGKYGSLQIGPRGVFKITPGSDLEVIVDKPSKLREQIKQRHGNSMIRFKDALKKPK
jgi:hypothetical protein